MRGQHLKPKQTDASTKHATLLKQKVVSRTGLSQSRTPNLYCNPRNPMLHTQTSKSYILATLNPKSIPDMLRSFVASSAYAAESSSCLGISGLGAIDVYQVHSFIHSFIRSFIESFMHCNPSLIRSFHFISFHLFMHSFLPSFVHSFIKTYVHVCVSNYSFLYLSCICHLSMLHVHINTYITHTYVHTYIHTHTYIHEYIHTDMHTNTYICTYIYIYIHT